MKQECVMVGKEKIDLDMAMREFDRLSDRIIDLVDDYSFRWSYSHTPYRGNVPSFVFGEVAEKWDILIRWGERRGQYGSYQHGAKIMRLEVVNPSTFYHELGHASHARYNAGNYYKVSHAISETIAEMTGLILGTLKGDEDPFNLLGYSAWYILQQSQSWTKRAVRCRLLRVRETVKQCLRLILEDASEVSLRRGGLDFEE